MTDVCREFGVSHKTGYKIFHRPTKALSGRSRRPLRYSNQLLEQIEKLMVGFKAGKVSPKVLSMVSSAASIYTQLIFDRE